MLIDVDMLRSRRLVECVYEVGQALLLNQECQVPLDPDVDSKKYYKTVITVKEDEKLSLHGLWCPALDTNFQRRLLRNEATYKSFKPQDEWRSTKSWVGLGTGITDFLDFVRALTNILPSAIGGGQNVATASCVLYEKLADANVTDLPRDLDASIAEFKKFTDHLQNDKGSFELAQAALKGTFLDKFILKEVYQGRMSKQTGRLAKTTLASAAGIFLNTYELENITGDNFTFINRLKGLISAGIREQAFQGLDGDNEEEEDRDLTIVEDEVDEEEQAERARTNRDEAEVDAAAYNEIAITKETITFEQLPPTPEDGGRKRGGAEGTAADLGEAEVVVGRRQMRAATPTTTPTSTRGEKLKEKTDNKKEKQPIAKRLKL